MLWLLATVPAEATVSSSFVPVTNGFNYQHHQTVRWYSIITSAINSLTLNQGVGELLLRPS